MADGILLLALGVVRAHILPQLFVHVNDIVEVLDHRGAEVDSEVPAVIVATDVPALVAVVLVRRFVIFEGLNSDGVEVVESVVERVDDGAGVEWFFGIGCEG